MRTVSFFGSKEGGIGGGLTEPDNGREAAGGFGGGKKFLDKTSSEGDCGEEGTGELPVSRTGNWIRTVSRGFTVSCGVFRGNWMPTVSFFGWSGSAITLGEIDQKSRSCHDPILELKKVCLR